MFQAVIRTDEIASRSGQERRCTRFAAGPAVRVRSPVESGDHPSVFFRGHFGAVISAVGVVTAFHERTPWVAERRVRYVWVGERIPLEVSARAVESVRRATETRHAQR